MDTLCIVCTYNIVPDAERSYASSLCEAILRFFMGADIIINRPEGKKPYCDDFEFNFSHTAGAVAVIISDTPVGVDIEKIRQPRLKAAKRLFTENELCVAEDKFWQIWTAKEAIAKASGRGLGSYLSDIDTLSPAISAQLHRHTVGEFFCTACSDTAPKFILHDSSLFLKD